MARLPAAFCKPLSTRMLRLLFTLDYEIHGNGEGSPLRLMVEPTDRMLRLFDQFGAKLTIMADVAEILRFKEWAGRTGRDEFHYHAILDQLQRAVRGGHDVQLHIHSSYFNAEAREGRWIQDWSEYSFATLPRERMDFMVSRCKAFLESALQPVDSSYRCSVFRAANWAVSPSRDVVPVLLDNGIRIDTSVFKFGSRRGMVHFDYGSAHHALLPWRADPEDICRANSQSSLWEFPIYTECRGVGAFLTFNRFYRAVLGRFHRVPRGEPRGDAAEKEPRWGWLIKKHAWKADFNQCSGRQLIRSLRRAEAQAGPGVHAPCVLIGHSKLFTHWNAVSLRPLLAFVRANPSRFGFGTFGCFLKDLEPEARPSLAAGGSTR